MMVSESLIGMLSLGKAVLHLAVRRTDLLTCYCDYSPGTSCSIYVNKEAKGRDRFGKFDDDIYKN